jgi:hypothetical protein
MRRILLGPCVAVLLALAIAAPASAGVSGTYRVTSTAGPMPTDVNHLAASATWRFTGGPRQGQTHAFLAQAAQGPFVTPCTENGDGTITDRITGPAHDTAAVFNYAMTMDLLKGKGVVDLQLGQEQIGFVTQSTDRECTGPFAAGNGITLLDTLATFLFPVGTVGYDPWPLHKGADKRWHIDAQQTAVEPGLGSSTATVHVTLSGSLQSLRAMCKVPTVRDLRHATTFKKGIALVRKAGFAKPSIGRRHIRWAPKGRLYLDELGDATTALCGRKLHLYRS